MTALSLSMFLWPLLKLLAGLSAGLFLASILEASGWTQHLARLAAPLAKAAHLGCAASSSFSLAFVSSSASNALLSEKYQKGQISFAELIIANMFNSLPAWFSHTPAIFFLVWPVLGAAAFDYVGLTLAAAIIRLCFTLAAGYLLLPPSSDCSFASFAKKDAFNLNAAFKKAVKMFRMRIMRLLYFTVPFYILMIVCQKTGVFKAMEGWLAANLDWLAVLKPEAMGIVALQIMAEMGAALGAAAAVLEDGAISAKDIVIAMLVGNVLAIPLRSLRHQLPLYAGFYPLRPAFKLLFATQGARAASLVLVIIIYGAL